MLIVQYLGAPRPTGRRRRRAKSVEPDEPLAVPVSRVTVTGTRLESPAEGSAWIQSMMGGGARGPAEIRRATHTINRALSALRAGAKDPLVHEVAASRALAIRIGHASGQELAEGRWTEAKELPPRGKDRFEEVEPQARVAAVLAGRDEVHPAETLMLRASLDAEQGREGEARFGLRAARAALEEDPSDRSAALRKQLERIEQKMERDSASRDTPGE